MLVDANEDAPRRYVAELTVPPSSGVGDIQAIAARSRAACSALAQTGTHVRFLRSLFVPEDGTCFLLFESGSAAAVEQAGKHAALPARRIDQALRIDCPRDHTEEKTE